MTRGRNALGRGLGALLPNAGASRASSPDYFACSVDRIDADPSQPRQSFDDVALDELVASIAAKGVLQPIIVRRDGTERFVVVAGERRLRAARRAGLSDVPVIVKDVASDEAFELALIENLQREDLNPIEEANAYARLIGDSGYTQEVLAERIGKNRSTVANALRLLKLGAEHQQLLIDGALTSGHARCLLAVEEPSQRAALARQITEQGWTVRQAERAAKASRGRRSKGAKPSAGKRPRGGADAARYETIAKEISAALGVRVAVSTKARSSRIQLDFASVEDLLRLRDRLVQDVSEAVA